MNPDSHTDTINGFDSTSGSRLPHEAILDEVHWHQAISSWRDTLGSEAVIEDVASLEKAGGTAIPRAHCPGAILRPKTVDQISSCLKIAHQFELPLYPISRGKNWGYGTASPATAGQVQMDLSQMDQILEINEELGYAVIEPGVSQGQLAQVLKQRGSGLMLDVTGAGPDASIVGNTLEQDLVTRLLEITFNTAVVCKSFCQRVK